MSTSRNLDDGPNEKRNESDLWHRTYASEEEVRRRSQAFPRKFGLIGIDRAPRDIAVLDMCCGHGEALNCLYEIGFRNLSGVDLEVEEKLLADSRLRVRVGNAFHTEYPAASFDWVLNIHSMHHFASLEGVQKFLDESFRLLKPGGRLSIIDFPASPQILLAFWFFRQDWFLRTRYLKWFGKLLQEEWHFLKSYLPQWPKVRTSLLKGKFQVESNRRRLFYFYLTLRKPS